VLLDNVVPGSNAEKAAAFQSGDALISISGGGKEVLLEGFNYDATISTLTSYNAFRSAYEFSLIWNGIYGGLEGNERAMKCPKF
jgi:hypothetical protein